MSRSIGLAMAVGLATAASYGQTTGAPADLANSIPKLMRLAEVPGLSLAVVEHGKIRWLGAFGVKSAKTGERVDEDTVFPAASLSKVVFAYAVLKLADAGRLDLDAPLARFVPGYVDGDARVDKITARYVLTHRSGFPNWRPSGKPLVIYFDPGTRFSYSGEGFVYLQRAVEKIVGKPLEAFVKESVFVPLGMADSSYVWQEKYETTAVAGHSEWGEAFELGKTVEGKSPINGAGGPSAASTLLTTARDYAKFTIAVMNGTGLRKETAARMLTAQSPVDAACANCVGRAAGPVSEWVAWGLGVGLVKTAGGTLFWHWGDNGNFKAFVAGDAASKRSVAVFTNSANGMMIIPDIVEAAIGEKVPAFDWIHYERYDSARMRLYRDILERGIDAALRAYGTPGSLNEDEMNRLGLRLLRTKRLKEATRILERTAEEWPNSANAWDSLGWAYMLSDSRERAIASYRKSLELDPNNRNAVDALKKLEGN